MPITYSISGCCAPCASCSCLSSERQSKKIASPMAPHQITPFCCYTGNA
nr:MAG TPA: agouti-related protein [Caudoviricetes sp.]